MTLNTYGNTRERIKINYTSDKICWGEATKLVYVIFYILSTINIIFNEICLVKNSQNPSRVDISREK